MEAVGYYIAGAWAGQEKGWPMAIRLNIKTYETDIST
jgi:hypothetical protein